MRGVDQHCQEKHLHRSLAEFDFHYNGRSIDDDARAVRSIKGAEGKRLTCRGLTVPKPIDPAAVRRAIYVLLGRFYWPVANRCRQISLFMEGSMIDQDKVQIEMRLSALEYLMTKLFVAHIVSAGFSDEKIQKYFDDLREGAAKQIFPGFDPAISDYVTSEWESAIASLLDAQKRMLAQFRPPKL